MKTNMKFIISALLAVSVHGYSEDKKAQTPIVNDELNKVCVLTLKGEKQTVADELETYNCKKGDILYLMETQLLGMTQHTVAMSASRVCDLSYDVKTFALQHSISAVCKYSGQILPIAGNAKTLKMGDQFIKK